jgi:DedD protein
MDEQVKARLIGATVLVIVAVALVPELLSGRKPEAGDAAATPGKRGTRTYTIDLGGAVASGARLEPVPGSAPPPRETSRLPTVAAPGTAVNSGRDAPAADEPPAISPAATVASSEPVAPPPAQPAARASAAPVVASNETRPSAAGKGGWSVQVGAFGSADSARRLVTDLKGDGLRAYVAPLERNGKTLHRVRVGPEPTRADADKLATRLKSRGLPASVVAAE